MTNKKEVLITGATGLVGSRLTEMLIERGYTVKHLVRNLKRVGVFRLIDGMLKKERWI